jgi:hypothetical protein
MENQTVTVRARLAFPSLDQELTYKGAPTGKYGVQLANLSGPAVEKLEELGITIKSKADDKYERGQFIECKSKFPMDNSGKYPVLFEADGKTHFEGHTSSIGYGTVVRATIRPYPTQDGAKPSLVKMAIEELVTPEVETSDEEGEVL